MMLFTSTLLAQENISSIQFLDKESNTPITFAHFQHGSQQGVSDENGFVYFQLEEGEKLILSHLNYGSFSLNYDTLSKVIEQKYYYQVPIHMNLYPVTIVGIKAHSQIPEEEIQVQYTDKMEHDAVAILNQIPAFNSIRKGGNYGFDPVFRGFKYEQLNIVLNGAQSATAACPNRMDPPTSQMSPNMMHKIEVLKGPYALRYGTGVGATINFIPKPLQFTAKANPYGRVSSGYETNGNIGKAESQLGVRGAKYDMSLFGSWSQGDDYLTGNRDTVNANFSRISVGLDLGFKISKNQELRFFGMYNKAKDVDFPTLAMDLRKDNTWLFNVQHDVVINKKNLQKWNSTIYGSFVDHLMDNLLKEVDPRLLNASTNAKTYNYGGRTEGIWLFKTSKLYTGADFRMEGAQGIREREFIAGPNAGKIFFDDAWQEGSISKTSLFSEYQWKYKTLNFVLSGRLEYNQAKLNSPSDEFSSVYSTINNYDINPSVSMGIQKLFNKQVTTGIWLGRAQRSAGLTERFINYFPVGQDPYELLGNPDLKPEVNNQADLTFEWKPMEHSLIQMDVYFAYMQNYISSRIDTSLNPRLPSSPGVRQYLNIDEAIKTGFEISWMQKLIAGLHHQFAIAYTYGQDLELDEALPEIAPLDLRYTLFGNYFNNKLKPEVMLRYVSSQKRISSEFGETVSPSFFILDVKLAYQLNEHLAVNAGINNLLNANYY